MSDADIRLGRNTKLLYLSNFLAYSFYIDAIDILFGTHYLHLDYLKAGSLFFAGWFVSIFLDFYGGVFADKVGRKRAQLLGLSIQALSFVPYLFTKSYPLLLLAIMVWGVGLALSSNTIQALVYEEAKEVGDLQLYQHVNATAQIWTFLGIAVASLIGGIAYVINPRLPYLLTTLSIAGAVIVSSQIRVPTKVERAVDAGTERLPIIKMALATFRNHPVVAYFVVISFFAGITGDMLFSYYQPLFISLHVSALVLGITFAAIRVVSGAGSYLMRKLPNVMGAATIQLLFISMAIVTTALLLIVKKPFILLVPLIFAVGSGFTEPNLRLFINKFARNEARAATISFATMCMNLGVGIGFVISYVLADRLPSRQILHIILVSTMATLVLCLYGIISQHKKLPSNT